MKHRRFLITVAACLVLLAQSAATKGEQSPAASQSAAQSREPTREKTESRKVASASPERKPGEQPASSQGDQEQDVPVEPPQEDRSVINTQPLPPEPGRFRFEFGVLPRYNSNLFGATAGAPRQAAFITTLAAKVEADLVRGEKSTLTGRFGFHRNLYQGVDGADSSDFDISLEYGFGRNRLALTYFTTPRRLAYIAGDEHIFNRLDGVDLRFSRRMTRRTRARVGYEFTRESFPTLKERDSGKHELSGDVRYRIHDLLAPGIGFELGRVTAQSANFNRHETALLLLLDSRIKDTVWASLRYRYSQRDYITADPTASNFGREDRRHDLRWQANVKVTKQWWLFFYNSYTSSASTRELRSFTGHELGAGLFFRFP
jgi:hypothetical protein